MSAIALRRGISISAISTLPSRTFEYISLSSVPVLEIDRIAEVSHMKDAYDQYDRAMNLYDRILGRLPSYKPRWYTRHCLGLLGIEAHWRNQLPLFLHPPLNLKHLRKDAYEFSNTLSDVDLFAREAFEAYLITSIARFPIEARVLTNVVYYPISEPRLVSQLWVPCRQVDLEDSAITTAHLAELPFCAHLHYPEDSVADLDELPFQEQIKKAVVAVPRFGDIPWSKINLPLLDETNIEVEEGFKMVDVADMQTTAQIETYLLENSEDCVKIFVPDDAQAPSNLCSSDSSEPSDGCKEGNHSPFTSQPSAPHNSSHQTTPECPICTDTITLQQGVELLCGHLFCRDCSMRWLQDHSRCPTCRRRLYSSKPMRGCHYKIETMDGRVLEVLRMYQGWHTG